MRWAELWFAFVMIGGCGGKVVVDEPSAGASGASSGAGGGATMSVVSSSSSGSDCAALQKDYDAKLAAAMACSPTLQTVQCSCSVTVQEACGCPVLVNETQPSLVQAAQAARDAWLAAGCTMSPCPGSCPAACAGTGQAYCEPSADGTTGICAVQFSQ